MNTPYWITNDTRTFMSRGYLQEGVSVEQRIRQIAEIAQDYLTIAGYANKFEDYMNRGFFGLSTPVWCNYGLPKALPISCFGSWIDDSITSILNKTVEIGQMSKLGGGTSAYFGALRPRGSPISVGGKSDGPFSFLDIYQSVVNSISQGQTRRGNCAVYLPVEHPDIKEWLHIKDEDSPIQDLSFGVSITDAWMESMLAGDKDKQKIWTLIIKKKYETGYPYIFWFDTVNNGKRKWYKDQKTKIYHGNLCVAGNTKILTDRGHLSIQELVDQEVNVWNGFEWSKVIPRKTGSNQQLLKIKFSDGRQIKCTPYHKFYIQETYRSVEKEVSAFELKIGDKLIKFNLPIIKGEKILSKAYTNGFFTGDGTYSQNKPRIDLYGEKQLLKQYIENDNYDWLTSQLERCDRISTMVGGLEAKFFVPNASYTIESRVNWLSGLFDADGTVARNGTNESIQLVSINFKFLRELQFMLQTLGVNAKIVHAHDAGLTQFRADQKSYMTKEARRILINSNDVYKLMLLGLETHRLKIKIREPQRSASWFAKVVSISEVEELQDTFCFTEHKRHFGIFNGILTGQCNEICLPNNENESFVCCLSSMNLLKYDEWKDTDAVKILSYFLDSVLTDFIDKGVHVDGMLDAVRFAERHRAIGVGVLGWHSLLQSKMIPFESVEAKKLNVEIFKRLKVETDTASQEMAVMYGEPEVLKGYGYRNSALMALAPTTSNAFILGQVSQSIEPENSNYYVKDNAKGRFTYKNPYLKKLLKNLNQDTKVVWDSILEAGGSVAHLSFLSEQEKKVFATFGEIPQIEIITQAAMRQEYIDQGQSLNLKIHPKAPAKDTSKLMIEAWKLGIKGLYYQRSTAPTVQFNRDLMTCMVCEA